MAKWYLCFLIHYVCHSFSSKEQASFNFIAAVTIRSDFGAQENKWSVTAPTFPPSICHEMMRPDAMILVFLMFNFKPAFYSPLSSSAWMLNRLCSLKAHLHIQVIFSYPIPNCQLYPVEWMTASVWIRPQQSSPAFTKSHQEHIKPCLNKHLSIYLSRILSPWLNNANPKSLLELYFD